MVTPITICPVVYSSSSALAGGPSGGQSRQLTAAMQHVRNLVKSYLIALLTLLLASAIPSTCRAAPIVLGLTGKHPLLEEQTGELLIGEMRCLACHTRNGAAAPLEKSAPDLSDVGSRVAPAFLRRFIAYPSTSHSGTAMPDLFAAETEEDRNKFSEAITHFLVAQSPRKFSLEAIKKSESAVGKGLFHTIGCIACHSPRDDAGKEMTPQGVVELGHVPAKYSLSSLTDFLFQPQRVRPSGRMPDMKLTPVEAKAIASYLLDGADTNSAPLPPRDELVAIGKMHFQQFKCAACHKIGDIPAAPTAVDLAKANPERGCLTKTPGKSPWFDLSVEQGKAIRAALTKPPESISDKTRLESTLTAFNCIACHIRDDFGGVPADRNLLFKSTATNLGDDARIPPPLTLAGAKLQTVWMKKVLFDGESVRPSMFTRMPQFGEANLRHLPDLFARLDKVEPFAFSLPNAESGNKKERDRAKEMREAGRKLLGNTSLGCVACHNFNGKTPQTNGTELMISHERLKPSWFYHFLRNPNAFRPRIVMPAAWAGGKAADKSVLGGDTDRQIEAIWYYLSLGTSAADPAGVQPSDTKLLVADATRTYRGRSRVAGFRGIAVGFPEKLSYAFNAETGALSAIWRGDFVRVDRGGQGSGSFHPAGKFAPLPQDVSFWALPDERTPWPLLPVMTKDAPVNPDPLYPKNRGYQFKGYFMDDAAIPTFQYCVGDIGIEDRSTVGSGDEKGRLLRDLTFDAPKATTIWFRALTGKIETESKQRFKNAELRIDIPAVRTLLRPSSADAKSSELLLELEIPQGKSNLSFAYETLK
jgi:mono/diheme cytochrome c family protein